MGDGTWCDGVCIQSTPMRRMPFLVQLLFLSLLHFRLLIQNVCISPVLFFYIMPSLSFHNLTVPNSNIMHFLISREIMIGIVRVALIFTCFNCHCYDIFILEKQFCELLNGDQSTFAINNYYMQPSSSPCGVFVDCTFDYNKGSLTYWPDIVTVSDRSTYHQIYSQVQVWLVMTSILIILHQHEMFA